MRQYPGYGDLIPGRRSGLAVAWVTAGNSDTFAGDKRRRCSQVRLYATCSPQDASNSMNHVQASNRLQDMHKLPKDRKTLVGQQ